MTDKKRKIVLLPTDKAENCLLKNSDSTRLTYHPHSSFFQEYLKTIGSTSQHLYILSDEEIKEGDWSIDILNNIVEKTNKATVDMLNSGMLHNGNSKIIATTDLSLKLPKIPQHFIDKYIIEYNKDNKIEEVMIGYNQYGAEIGTQYLTMSDEELNPIKISNNNNISIKLIKDSWNRKEVLKLLHSAWLKGSLQHANPLDKQSYTNFIKENL